jgi:hypothetical protein
MIQIKINEKKKFINDLLIKKTELQLYHIVALIDDYLVNDFFILKE